MAHHTIIETIALQGRDISGQELQWKSAEGQDISGLVAIGAGLYQVNLRSCAAPTKAPIFDRADMMGAGLDEAVLPGASFRSTNLSGIQAKDVTLQQANLDGAVLDDAHVVRGNLSGANLHGMRARGAALYMCRLIRADARGADFTGAQLSRSDIRGMDLSGAIGLDTCTMECVWYDSTTRWPAGFVPPVSVDQMSPLVAAVSAA